LTSESPPGAACTAMLSTTNLICAVPCLLQAGGGEGRAGQQGTRETEGLRMDKQQSHRNALARLNAQTADRQSRSQPAFARRWARPRAQTNPSQRRTTEPGPYAYNHPAVARIGLEARRVGYLFSSVQTARLVRSIPFKLRRQWAVGDGSVCSPGQSRNEKTRSNVKSNP